MKIFNYTWRSHAGVDAGSIDYVGTICATLELIAAEMARDTS